jgi:L-aminopeptidase/D-esterase-like protein
MRLTRKGVRILFKATIKGAAVSHSRRHSTSRRARDLFQFDGITGSTNSIVDVQGVLVGHSNDPPIPGDTLPSGVTVVLPQGYDPTKTIPVDGFLFDSLVPAAWFTLNGNGEMTGTHVIEELGLVEGPIVLTNTLAVGTVRDAVIAYALGQNSSVDPDEFGLKLPVVAETDDSWLYDAFLKDGPVVNQGVVFQAIENALAQAPTSPGKWPVAGPAEGPYGGGTSNTCYSWRGGSGSASRSNILVYWHGNSLNAKPGYKVGVLVQANQGTFWDLVIRGVPVGTIMRPPCSPDDPPPAGGPNPTPPAGPAQGCPGETAAAARRVTRRGKQRKRGKQSSIIVVIATDAPLLPSQLERLARRACLGIGRTGTITNDDSGEIFVAFSTANPNAFPDGKLGSFQSVPDESIDPLFEAVVNATEEAILNALVAPPSVAGRRNRTAWWILDPKLQTQTPPVPKLTDVMDYYRRSATSNPYPG